MSNFTGSLPLKGDSWHMVVGSIGYVIGFSGSSIWLAILLARFNIGVTNRNTDKAMVFFLIFAITIILVETGERWPQGTPTILRGNLLLGMATLGLGVSWFIYAFFKKLGIEHSHGHSHHLEEPKEDKKLKANIAHTFTDLISSLAVIGSALIARWFNQTDFLRLVDVGVPILIIFILGNQMYGIVMEWREHNTIIDC